MEEINMPHKGQILYKPALKLFNEYLSSPLLYTPLIGHPHVMLDTVPLSDAQYVTLASLSIRT